MFASSIQKRYNVYVIFKMFKWTEMRIKHTHTDTHTPCHANQLGPTLFKSMSPAGLFAEESQMSCSLSFLPIRGSGLHYCRPAGCRLQTLRDRQADIKIQALIFYNLCWRLKDITHSVLSKVHLSVCLPLTLAFSVPTAALSLHGVMLLSIILHISLSFLDVYPVRVAVIFITLSAL